MKQYTTIGIVALSAAAYLSITPVHAQTQDSALLNALVKKGVLSNAEAQDIEAQDLQEYNTTAASKLSISNYVSKITFYGDGRLRYDGLWQHNYQAQSQNVQDRYRYRLRFGLDYNYSDNLKAGFELVSSTTDDSGNQTMGGTFTNASINVGKIYVQYQPTDWLTLTGGKFANPWYATTDDEYSNDLYPEGAAETFKWIIPLGGSSAPVADAKDMKAMAPAGFQQSLSVGLNLVQFDYITSNQSAIIGAASTTAPAFNTSSLIQNNNNVGIIGTQIPVEWKITKDMSAKIAPGFTFYTGGGNTNFQGGVPTNSSNAGTPSEPAFFYGTANSSSDPVFISPREADDLNIVSAPGEFDFKIGSIPAKIYEDFSWNVTGKERVQNVFLQPGGSASIGLLATTTAPAGSAPPAAGSTSKVGYGSVPTSGSALNVQSQNQGLGDNLAWAAGVQIGQNKKKGDWSILGEFRQIGLGAVDPNINGTDYADSYSNEEGIKTSAVYNFTDFLTGTVTFYDTWAYKNNLYEALNNGASTTSASSPAAGTTQSLVDNKSLQRVQVDLGWKF